MKWITRKNIKVDRVACPWLIRTLLTPKLSFYSSTRVGYWRPLTQRSQFRSTLPGLQR